MFLNKVPQTRDYKTTKINSSVLEARSPRLRGGHGDWFLLRVSLLATARSVYSRGLFLVHVLGPPPRKQAIHYWNPLRGFHFHFPFKSLVSKYRLRCGRLGLLLDNVLALQSLQGLSCSGDFYSNLMGINFILSRVL